MKTAILSFLSILLLACGTQIPEGTAPIRNTPTKDFSAYWYAGKGELTSYHLEQNRYGETRVGDAVFIFVTEPFSAKKQVKLDYPETATAGDEVPVLKLNALRKFSTGIYDYSMMQSVFTPVQLEKHPQTLKITCSSQDWCGHSFTQINHKDKDYRVRQYSYFESEGDEDYAVNEVLLEDEIWTRLRINPAALPTGNVDILPGTFYSRLAHQPLKATKARILIKTKNESTSQCKIEYLHFNRTLEIDFQTEFPHQILAWTETNDQASSKATLKQTMRVPYWELHNNKHAYLRDSLGLK